MKENGFTLKKVRSRRYPAETIMDTDGLALLKNRPIQVESLLLCLVQAARGIGHYISSELIGFKQNGATSTLNGEPLRLVDQFTYHGSNISSTERDISILIEKG